jgi:hypothetical protein
MNSEDTGGSSVSRRGSDAQLLAQCRWEAFRGSGPGGQKRNKTSSAVRMTHIPTGIAVIAGESRSQAENRARALRRLRHRMVIALREPVQLEPFEPPDWFVRLRDSGRLGAKTPIPDALAAIALMLDVLASVDWSISKAAAAMGLSTAGLSQALARDDKVWASVNQHRTACGLRPLVG